MAGGTARSGERAGRRAAAPGVVEATAVKVATYNIHTCIGVDGRYDPPRVGAVLREIDADIACLQEVAARRRVGRQPDQWAYLGEVTGRQVITGAGIRERPGRFGNAILTR